MAYLYLDFVYSGFYNAEIFIPLLPLSPCQLKNVYWVKSTLLNAGVRVRRQTRKKMYKYYNYESWLDSYQGEY